MLFSSKSSKEIQSRFFSGNVLAQNGKFLTAEEVAELRKKITKPFYSKFFNETF